MTFAAGVGLYSVMRGPPRVPSSTSRLGPRFRGWALAGRGPGTAAAAATAALAPSRCLREIIPVSLLGSLHHRQSASFACKGKRRYPAALSNLFTLFEPIAVALRLTKWRKTITVFTAVMPRGRGARQEAGRGNQ